MFKGNCLPDCLTAGVKITHFMTALKVVGSKNLAIRGRKVKAKKKKKSKKMSSLNQLPKIVYYVRKVLGKNIEMKEDVGTRLKLAVVKT